MCGVHLFALGFHSNSPGCLHMPHECDNYVHITNKTDTVFFVLSEITADFLFSLASDGVTFPCTARAMNPQFLVRCGYCLLCSPTKGAKITIFSISL